MITASGIDTEYVLPSIWNFMAMLNIVWYEFQLDRMAHNKKPKANLSEWGVFFKTITRAGVYAFRKRRG